MITVTSRSPGRASRRPLGSSCAVLAEAWGAAPVAALDVRRAHGVTAAHWCLEPAHDIPVPGTDTHLFCVALSPARRHALWIDGRDAGSGAAPTGSVRVVPAAAGARVEVDASPRRDGRFEFFHFYVPPRAFSDAELGLDVGNPHLVDLARPAAGEVDPVLEHLSRALAAGLRDPVGSLDRLFTDHTLLSVLTHLARRYARLTSRAVPPGGLARWRVRRALDYIEANLSREISLADLARSAELTERHFCTAFGRSMGVSPYRYVQSRRIARASELLTDPSLSIVAVALSVGFANSAHFATAFRRQHGVTPSRYRKEVSRRG